MQLLVFDNLYSLDTFKINRPLMPSNLSYYGTLDCLNNVIKDKNITGLRLKGLKKSSSNLIHNFSSLKYLHIDDIHQNQKHWGILKNNTTENLFHF